MLCLALTLLSLSGVIYHNCVSMLNKPLDPVFLKGINPKPWMHDKWDWVSLSVPKCNAVFTMLEQLQLAVSRFKKSLNIAY